MMEYHAVTCPACGREVQAPEGLETVICVYCGNQFGIAPPQEENEALGDYRAAYDQAVALLTDSVTAAQDALAVFRKRLYPDSFLAYYDKLKPSQNSFARAYEASDGDRDRLVADYAWEFGRRILEHYGQPDKKNTMHTENYVYHYVAFAVPAILYDHRRYSDQLADLLLETWNSRYPRRKLAKASFETINGGFKHKWCYITSAVARSLSLPEGRYALACFRRFRDEWLAKQPQGALAIMEYYLTAPAIVQAIDRSPSRALVYREIWEKHLRHCLSLYEKKHYPQCRRAYEEMVGRLREKWI